MIRSRRISVLTNLRSRRRFTASTKRLYSAKYPAGMRSAETPPRPAHFFKIEALTACTEAEIAKYEGLLAKFVSVEETKRARELLDTRRASWGSCWRSEKR